MGFLKWTPRLSDLNNNSSSNKLTYNHNFGVYTYVFRVKVSSETAYKNIKISVSMVKTKLYLLKLYKKIQMLG